MTSLQSQNNNSVPSCPSRDFRVNNISKYFGKTPALININLALGRGKVHCVCGANAAGKSTLVKLIAGLGKPDKGKITKPEKSKTGLMLHQSMLYPKLSIEGNLQFYAHLYGIREKKKRINELLEALGLEDSRLEKTETLSAGMKKRAGFARAVINTPELLLLDEPFSGMDKEGTAGIKTCIKELGKKNSAILITTHQINEVIEFCDEISVLDKAKLIMSEKVENIDRQAFCRDYLSWAEQYR